MFLLSGSLKILIFGDLILCKRLSSKFRAIESCKKTICKSLAKNVYHSSYFSAVKLDAALDVERSRIEQRIDVNVAEGTQVERKTLYKCALAQHQHEQLMLEHQRTLLEPLGCLMLLLFSILGSFASEISEQSKRYSVRSVVDCS